MKNFGFLTILMFFVTLNIKAQQPVVIEDPPVLIVQQETLDFSGVEINTLDDVSNLILNDLNTIKVAIVQDVQSIVTNNVQEYRTTLNQNYNNTKDLIEEVAAKKIIPNIGNNLYRTKQQIKDYFDNNKKTNIIQLE